MRSFLQVVYASTVLVRLMLTRCFNTVATTGLRCRAALRGKFRV